MEIAGLERLECEFRSIDRRHGKLSEATTAGLVVIGYEILTGETADSNTGFAMNALREVRSRLESKASSIMAISTLIALPLEQHDASWFPFGMASPTCILMNCFGTFLDH